jgi:nicotinate phosphoribosyltransferase
MDMRFYEFWRLVEDQSIPPIINSLLDTDWYKLTMGQVIFHKFPHANAGYKFINRGKHEFPLHFDEELRKQVQAMSQIKLQSNEIEWLRSNDVMQEDYIDWLSRFQFDPSQVDISQNGTDLDITVEGPWVETIFWEVPLMALISELYYKLGNKTADMQACRLKMAAEDFPKICMTM